MRRDDRPPTSPVFDLHVYRPPRVCGSEQGGVFGVCFVLLFIVYVCVGGGHRGSDLLDLELKTEREPPISSSPQPHTLPR